MNNHSEWKLLINHGAKRSGKTFLDNLLFLQELARVRAKADELEIDHPQYILAGFTLSNIQRNILLELNNMGIDLKFDKYNGFELMGVNVVQTSTGSIGGIGRIRGMTAFGAYINEATLCNQEVFNEIRSRCSVEGSRVICDTNTDHPEHWLLKDYIEKAGENGIVANHFSIDDNDFLADDYVDNVKTTTPKGMFYDRDVKGLWVSGAGAVYPEFNKETMVIGQTEAFDRSYERYIAGIDWGFNHPTAFVVCGYDHGKITLLEEHCDSKKQIGHWIEVAKSIQERFPNVTFYSDTNNSEHNYDLREVGINVQNGSKEVINGIQYVAGVIHNNKFKVVYDEAPEFRKEIYQYVWNDKTGDVVKDNDHVLDALRYAIYTDYLMHKQTVANMEDLGKLRRML